MKIIGDPVTQIILVDGRQNLIQVTKGAKNVPVIDLLKKLREAFDNISPVDGLVFTSMSSLLFMSEEGFDSSNVQDRCVSTAFVYGVLLGKFLSNTGSKVDSCCLSDNDSER